MCISNLHTYISNYIVRGRRSNRWSLITIRMGMLHVFVCVVIIYLSLALAVYTRSPAAFEALRSFNLLQLPGISTLKAYTSSQVEKPGEVELRLRNECLRYEEIKEHHRAAGNKVPLGEGALIVDEVKVAAKLHWNSRNDSIVGHAMSYEELSSFHNLYTLIDEPDMSSKTDYVLQTL